MSFWSRITNVFRGGAVSRDIDEELAAHLAEAATEGRDPVEARRAFGSPLRRREESRDIRLLPWLDSLRADAVFGWRQIRKKKIASAAAILSLALAMGTCATAFRLIDALLLRPLPVANADRLYVFAIQGLDPMGHFRVTESCEYPLFESLRRAARGQAELMAASWVERIDLTFASDQEMETAYRQYVSGWMFPTFKLRPALGRLFDGTDDDTPGKHPYAVLSYDYWTRRFGRDPKVLGRTFHSGTRIYQIIGVAPRPFTGTEPGTMTDIFIPAMMNAGVTEDDWAWIRTFVALNPGTTAKSLRDRLQPVFQVVQEERAKGFTGWPKAKLDNFLHQRVLVERAAGGVSQMRKDFERALTVLAALAALVLLITCANLANLLTAQAAVRAREMALRVSIGAGRGRLIQLVVTLLFSLAPALRASAVKPASALKGGADPHSRRRLMHGLVALQTAFCFLVLYAAGLLGATFERLSQAPPGFSAERLLTLNTVAERPQPQPYWDQVVEHLRTVPGVETVALASRPLLSGYSSNDAVAIDGGPPSEDMAYFLNVSPGFIGAMKIPFVDGRDFRAGDTVPGAAIVSEAFARRFFKGENPVGRWFERATDEGPRIRLQVVGLVRDARYLEMREKLLPVAYIPFRQVDAKGAVQPTRRGTLIVRTSSANPRALAQMLSREVARARPEFHVSNIETQAEINQVYTVRERLLAVLALFFAVVALLLAGVGLFGVLDYSVLQRRREIGIRMAIGAPAGSIARLVTVETFAMVLAGAVAGVALGMASVRYIEALFYQVKATDPGMLAFPLLTILAAALLAGLPAVFHAVRIDPVAMLRSE
jgi:hypothetical protein